MAGKRKKVVLSIQERLQLKKIENEESKKDLSLQYQLEDTTVGVI